VMNDEAHSRHARGDDAAMGGGEMTADELLAKAEKKMTTTLTRWKPDYDSAMLYFDEAGA